MKFLKPLSVILITLVSPAFLLCCALIGMDISGGSDDGKIKIAYLPITHSVPVMLLEDAEQTGSGGFEIELVRFNSWSEVVDALRTKRVDGASILFEVALKAKESDDSLVMVSLSHRDGNVVVANNSISSYQDLKGKTIAIPHKLSPQNTLLRVILEREKIEPEEVDIIEISPAEMPFSMASGTISAYIVAEPYGSVAISTGAGWILENSRDNYPDSVCCVMVFRKELFENFPEIKGRLLEDFAVAAKKAGEKGDEAVETFKRHSNFSDSVIESSFQKTFYEDLFLSEEEYEAITKTILRYKILDSVPDYADFVYK